MLVEKTKREALEAYLKGRKIRVITEYDDGSMEIQSIGDLFPVADIHYLVDVPAVEKEEFKELGRTRVRKE